MSDKYRPIPRYIANFYLEETLGSGYSGSIFKARHLHSGNVVALKVQRADHECPTNRYERYLFPFLKGAKGIPTYYDGNVMGEWDWLAMSLLGPSIDSLFRKSGKDRMELGTVCQLAMQIIARLETMHTRGVLHRDIQLGNIVIGLPPNEKMIYMIDFGFSKRYIDQGRHIPDSRVKRDFIGNYWFSSVNVHCRGRVPSRRDDLEAAALMLIHVMTPRGLSWTRNGVPKTDAAHDRLIAEKLSARPEDLCRGMPNEFEDFLRYTRKLKFLDTPDYKKWIEVFSDLAVENGYPASEDFIWPPKPPVKASRVPPRSTNVTRARDEMEAILGGLANLNFAVRPVLGERTNIEQAEKKTREALTKSVDRTTKSKNGNGSSRTVEGSTTGRVAKSKAVLLADLSTEAAKATNNESLGRLVLAFVQVLQMNSSRTLTKEASRFLDTLHKQLDDPSVFMTPNRAKTRSGDGSLGSVPSHAKLGVVARLRYEVGHAPNNQALAKLVSDFTQVTNKSVGKSITKDGFVFLEGVGQRLLALQ